MQFVCIEKQQAIFKFKKNFFLEFQISTNIIIMRTCCCCIPVNAGAMILGIIGFFICALELVGLIPYQLQLNEFNPIQDFVGVNFKMVKYHIDDFAKQHAVDNVTLKTLHEKLDEFLPPIFLGATVEAGVYAISCLLMLIGACCKVRIFDFTYKKFAMLYFYYVF